MPPHASSRTLSSAEFSEHRHGIRLSGAGQEGDRLPVRAFCLLALAAHAGYLSACMERFFSVLPCSQAGVSERVSAWRLGAGSAPRAPFFRPRILCPGTTPECVHCQGIASVAFAGGPGQPGGIKEHGRLLSAFSAPVRASPVSGHRKRHPGRPPGQAQPGSGELAALRAALSGPNHSPAPAGTGPAQARRVAVRPQHGRRLSSRSPGLPRERPQGLCHSGGLGGPEQ